MNKKILVVLSVFFLLNSTWAQKEYKIQTTVDGVEFYYMWSYPKKNSKETMPVLLVKVKNLNDFPVGYTLGVEIFESGKMVQSSPETSYCIGKKKTKKGKLNGHYYRFNLSVEDTKAPEFTVELSDLSIVKIEKCVKAPKEKAQD